MYNHAVTLHFYTTLSSHSCYFNICMQSLFSTDSQNLLTEQSEKQIHEHTAVCARGDMHFTAKQKNENLGLFVNV